MNLLGRIYKPLVAVTLAASMLGCGKGDAEKKLEAENIRTEEANKRAEEAIAKFGTPKTSYVPSTISNTTPVTSVPSTPRTTETVTTSGVTTGPTGPTPSATTTGPSVPATGLPTGPSVPGTSQPSGPSTPKEPTLVTPSVPAVTGVSEIKPARIGSGRKKKPSVTEFSYFPVLGSDSNFILGARASESLYGGVAQLNLDERFGKFRFDSVLDYRADNLVRGGEDSIVNTTTAQAGFGYKIIDCFEPRFLIGARQVTRENERGAEPRNTWAGLVGAGIGFDLKAAELQAYLSGMFGSGKFDSKGVESDKYLFARVNGIAKKHLGKGVSVGAVVNGQFEDYDRLTRILDGSVTGFLELKNLFGSGISGWAELTGRHAEFDNGSFRDSNQLLEGRIRALASLGNGFYLGGGLRGTYSRKTDRLEPSAEFAIAYDF